LEDRIYDIAGKHFSGSVLGPEEDILFSEWLKNKENAAVYRELQKTWELAGKTTYKLKADIDLEWARFVNARDNNKTRFLKPAYVFSIAAGIIALFGLFLFYNSNQNKEISISSLDNKTEILLPDNSRIWLNKQSTIKYNKKFGKNNRTIHLEGEALFDVQKAALPFEIFTPGEIKTRVLGTMFNLRAFKNESVTKLTVIRGKVSFGKIAEKNTALFTENQQASINISTGELIKENLFNENALSWHTQKLKFDNIPLKDVTMEISRYFNITLNMPANSDSLYFSGRFNQPLPEDIAKILDATFNWTHSSSNDTINFSAAN
jgi:transmembrane sensor